jgi:hypothetical protein
MLPPTVPEYFVTFGVQYRKGPDGVEHPLGMNADGYAVIEAPDMATAQRIADAIFQRQYAFIYDYANFIADGTRDRWHHEGELLRIAWQDAAYWRQYGEQE